MFFQKRLWNVATLYAWLETHKRTQKRLYVHHCLLMIWSQENCSSPRGVGVLGCGSERRFACFKGTRGLSQMSALQTRRYTLRYKSSSGRLLTFTLSVLQEQNNQAASHTSNSPSSSPTMTTTCKRECNQEPYLPVATSSVTKRLPPVANACPMMYVCSSRGRSPVNGSAGRFWPQPPNWSHFCT